MKRKFVLIVCFFCFKNAIQSQSLNVDAVEITVRSMEKTLPFYTKILPFKIVSDTSFYGEDVEALTGIFGAHLRQVTLQLGSEKIILNDYLTAGGRSISEEQKSNDLSFQHIAIVVSNMENAFKILKNNHVEFVSTVPQTLPKSIPQAEGIKAFYFHDPDNHNLELIYFPKGKGLPKWQNQNKLFLGIDHTAIGVSNSSSSHEFYQNILGLEKKGESFNKGNEQAHLNNIQNASLHISGYRVSKGIGVEFLEYLYPKSTKNYPEDSKPNDIWHWQTNIIIQNLDSVLSIIKEKGYKIISNKVVIEKNKKINYKSVLVRDNDGHAVLLKEIL